LILAKHADDGQHRLHKEERVYEPYPPIAKAPSVSLDSRAEKQEPI
jgi:hypothetical protein